jgi:hypothetical protein
MAQQQFKSKPYEPTKKGWEQSSMEWECHLELLRYLSDSMRHDYSNLGRYIDFGKRLPRLTSISSTFTLRILPSSIALYSSSTVRAREPQYESPRMLDYEVDCMPGTELPKLFHTGFLWNTSSKSCSGIMAQNCFGVSIIASAPDPTPILSTTPSNELSRAGSGNCSDLIDNTAYNHAFCTSQQIHRQVLHIES